MKRDITAKEWQMLKQWRLERLTGCKMHREGKLFYFWSVYPPEEVHSAILGGTMERAAERFLTHYHRPAAVVFSPVPRDQPQPTKVTV